MSSKGQRVAVVTGASGGIAKATADLLKQQGMAAIGLSRSLEATETTLSCDIKDEDSVANAFSEIAKRFGRIDASINAAAVTTTGEPLSATVKEWEETLRTNVIGTYLCCKYAIQEMLKQGTGSIVNISSVAGRSYSLTASVPYTSSKYAVIGLTRQLAARYGREGIRINCVCPSQTRTELLLKHVPADRLETLARANPLGRLAEPVEVAHTIAFLASEAASYINGAVVDVNGGML